ncbi:MAG: choice-of-anchor X domain-containing protein [Oceanococcus sp.]
MKNTWIAGLTLACLFAPAVQAATAPDLIKHAADAYRARADFPEWSQLITDAVDPVVRDRTPSRQRLADAQGAAPALETWGQKISYQPGQAVTLFARLDWLTAATGLAELSQLKLTQTSGWTMTADLLVGQGELAQLSYNDKGQAGDQVAGDGIYSAQFTPDASAFPALGQADNVLVKITAQNAAGEVRKAAGGFLLSTPGAVLTGEYKQVLRDGNLLVLAQADVLTAGRYHLSGSLANLAGTPLATAQSARVLEQGQHWLELPFYGLIFHRLQQVAGLQLSSLTLTSTNGMPNALGELHRDVVSLQAVPMAELTQASFADPQLLDAAQRLDLSRKINLKPLSNGVRRLTQ